jgi:hypothetical protein
LKDVFMGLSETILAAMIGAIATVSAALFQIVTAIKSRNKIDVKPRRGSTMRSILAVLALMVASAVGGFLYSELLKQRDGEDLRAMRMELRELKELTTAARVPAQSLMQSPPSVVPPEPQPATAAMNVNLPQGALRAESVAYVPACRRVTAEGQMTAACSEAEAQRIALCGSIPAYARIETIDLFAQPDAVQKPWEEHRASLEQDLGGARFTGKSFEYAQSSELKAVCVNFMQWSSEHSHIARIVVNYAFGQAETPASSAEQPIGAVSAVIAAEAPPPVSQQATLVTNTQP